ncbi:hypothetical protein A2U01_0036258 [Trifolium medium]|uniref:Uncharacterized protein n=1 Tax=Trifolium medium TaxID=97028 RepID=A0A392PSP5_9FABA|nr:hypothetical protein [Trifolium medium]
MMRTSPGPNRKEALSNLNLSENVPLSNPGVSDSMAGNDYESASPELRQQIQDFRIEMPGFTLQEAETMQTLSPRTKKTGMFVLIHVLAWNNSIVRFHVYHALYTLLNLLSHNTPLSLSS